MKKLLLLLIVLLSACTQSINYELEDEYFEERKGILYYKGTPFNGEVFSLNSNETLKDKGRFKEGKGLWDFYNNEGDLIVSGEKLIFQSRESFTGYFDENSLYKNFFIPISDLNVAKSISSNFNGLIRVKENNNLRAEVIVINGYAYRSREYSKRHINKIEREAYFFANSDKEKSEIVYKYYRNNGQLTNKKSYVFVDGNKLNDGLWEYYYENEQIESKESYKKGKEDGVWEYYNENGKLLMKGNFKNGLEDGLREYYHKNGQLESKGSNKEGKKDGVWEYYYENGQLESKESYKKGVKKDGIWESFYKNGQLKEKGSYKEDKKDGEWEYFYENGQLRGKGSFKNDLLEGLFKGYFENGQLKEKGRYKEGIQDGVWEYFNENGQLEEKVGFNLGKEISRKFY